MMLAWMGYSMLAAAALGVTAWLVEFACAGRFVRRRVLWSAVIFASACGPILFSMTRDMPTAAAGIGAARRAVSEPIVSDSVLLAAWFATSAFLALWFFATQRGLRRSLRIYSPRIVDGERVLVSADFGPAIVGVIRPQIVLPEWALAMRDNDRRIIVAHEAEHRQAHDPLLAALALLVVAALPWNAALWWQLRRLRLAIEIDCDRRVVSRNAHDPYAYGMVLLATHERVSRVMPAMAIAMAAMRSGLGRRIEALVDGPSRSPALRFGALAAAVALSAGIVSVPAPQLAVSQTPAPVQSSRARTSMPPIPEGYRVYSPSWAPNRAILVPIGDSLPAPR